MSKTIAAPAMTRIDRCPECGAPLQATAPAYLSRVAVNSDGGVIAFELAYAPGDSINVDEPARVAVYCENDHGLTTHPGPKPADRTLVLSPEAYRVLCGLVQTEDAIDGEDQPIDRGLVRTDDDVWDELRRALPASGYTRRGEYRTVIQLDDWTRSEEAMSVLADAGIADVEGDDQDARCLWMWEEHPSLTAARDRGRHLIDLLDAADINAHVTETYATDH
jgi:hypothetical protein